MGQVPIDVPASVPRYSFNKKFAPVLMVDPGTTVRFKTSEDSYSLLTGEALDSGSVNLQKLNALVGPVAIRGASPGDALGITIESITVGSRAYLVYPLRWRHLTFGLPDSIVEAIPVEKGHAVLPNGGRIPIRPMIGCIGVAPESGSVSSLSPAAQTGGNMDLVELIPGATIWLPVQIEGAMVSLGDVHARMGRGESVGAGLECSGEIVAIVHVAKSRALSGPVLVDSSAIHFVGTHPIEIDAAERIAVRAAWTWLSTDKTLSTATRLSICSALLDINLGGPAGANVVASFSRNDLRIAGVQENLWPIEDRSK